MSRGLIPSPLPVAYTDSREATERLANSDEILIAVKVRGLAANKGDDESNALKLSASPKFVSTVTKSLSKPVCIPLVQGEGEIRRSGREILTN